MAAFHAQQNTSVVTMPRQQMKRIMAPSGPGFSSSAGVEAAFSSWIEAAGGACTVFSCLLRADRSRKRRQHMPQLYAPFWSSVWIRACLTKLSGRLRRFPQVLHTIGFGSLTCLKSI